MVSPTKSRKRRFHWYPTTLKILNLVCVVGFTLWPIHSHQRNLTKRSSSHFRPQSQVAQPLVMQGGDPYIRALMRTITASEANVANPYHVIYGGKYIANLSRHPNRCVTIVSGPNRGNCSTAAGRYQFLNTTWAEKAKQYHAHPSRFEPQDQDAVVYAWLSDSHAWGVDLSFLLQEGQIKEVLGLLSGTWTSLGYGIETNSMSRHLPQIYLKLLREELAQVG